MAYHEKIKDILKYFRQRMLDEDMATNAILLLFGVKKLFCPNCKKEIKKYDNYGYCSRECFLNEK